MIKPRSKITLKRGDKKVSGDLSLIFVYFSHASSVLRRDITVSQKLFRRKEKSLKCPMDRKRHRSIAMELFRVKRKKSLCPEIGRTIACIFK